MQTYTFILLYLLNSLFWKWLISWGGARWLEGWKAYLIIDWFAAHWTAEQIRLYAVIMWLLTTLYFIVALCKPEYRF